jgi:hypothetical protein
MINSQVIKLFVCDLIAYLLFLWVYVFWGEFFKYSKVVSYSGIYNVYIMFTFFFWLFWLFFYNKKVYVIFYPVLVNFIVLIFSSLFSTYFGIIFLLFYFFMSYFLLGFYVLSVFLYLSRKICERINYSLNNH